MARNQELDTDDTETATLPDRELGGCPECGADDGEPCDSDCTANAADGDDDEEEDDA